jgi:Xaa-Pro aminopeptidase
VIGKASNQQRELYETYMEMRETTRQILKPGIKSSELDVKGKEICAKRGFEENHINGISHGIGLRFEENPASTIIQAHRSTKLKENMTMTIGHTILAISGYGGVRLEDIYLVTPMGGEILFPYLDDEWEIASFK